MKKIIMICVASILMLIVHIQSAEATPTLIQEDLPGDGTAGLMNTNETTTIEANSWITIDYIGSAVICDCTASAHLSAIACKYTVSYENNIFV